MSFDISKFRSDVTGQNQFTKESSFELVVALPAGLKTYNTKLVTLNCHVTNLPGSSLQTVSVRRGTNSLEEEMPLGKSFEDLSILVRNDGQGNVLGLFKDWQDLIYDDTGEGVNRNRISYRSTYITTINLNHFDLLGNEIISYTFHDAFPKQNSGINFSWDSTNIISLPVSFKYKRYTKKVSAISTSNRELTGNQGFDTNTGIPIGSFNI